jgi:hypothetical protein
MIVTSYINTSIESTNNTNNHSDRILYPLAPYSTASEPHIKFLSAATPPKIMTPVAGHPASEMQDMHATSGKRDLTYARRMSLI